MENIKPFLGYVLAYAEGVVVCGCTGHAASLTIDEQVGLIADVQGYVAQRFNDKKVIGGDGSNSTHESITFAQRVEKEAEVFDHLMISPYQNKPSQRGIFWHYAKIAEAIDGRIIIYTVPPRTGRNITAETTIRLAKEFPGKIIGVKEASGDLDQIAQIAAEAPREFAIYSGEDAQNVPIVKLAVESDRPTGLITVVGQIDPTSTKDLLNYALAGDYEAAEAVAERLAPLVSALFPKWPDDPNPKTTHYALRQIGIPGGVTRMPLGNIEFENKVAIDAALIGLGLK